MLSRLIILCAVGIFVLSARDGVSGGHLVSITISEYDYIIPIPSPRKLIAVANYEIRYRTASGPFAL